MGVDPYLKLIVGIESKKDDPRFNGGVRDCILSSHGAYFLWELSVPPLCICDRRCRDDLDLATGRPFKYVNERPEYSDIFYEGNPTGRSAWKIDGEPVGYVVGKCYEWTLLRCLSLVPGFYIAFLRKNGYLGRIPGENGNV